MKLIKYDHEIKIKIKYDLEPTLLFRNGMKIAETTLSIPHKRFSVNDAAKNDNNQRQPRFVCVFTT